MFTMAARVIVYGCALQKDRQPSDGDFVRMAMQVGFLGFFFFFLDFS